MTITVVGTLDDDVALLNSVFWQCIKNSFVLCGKHVF